ncbi:ABC transporter, partial [Halobacteriales archaeon SW_7_68_16]
MGAVARRDFLDARRKRLIWAPSVLYSLFVLLFFFVQGGVGEGGSFDGVLFALAGFGGVIVIPLIALVAAYLSVAGERESGAIKLTLSLPIDRAAVVLGKLLSRGAIVGVGIVIAL